MFHFHFIRMKHASDASCIFCKIVSGTIPSFKVFENEHVLAFLDINALSEGHTLVVPKHHAEMTHQLPQGGTFFFCELFVLFYM
jgi:galactose-1-phosphate uridylyltransferase